MRAVSLWGEAFKQHLHTCTTPRSGLFSLINAGQVYVLILSRMRTVGLQGWVRLTLIRICAPTPILT